jgi:hypothetical protein
VAGLCCIARAFNQRGVRCDRQRARCIRFREPAFIVINASDNFNYETLQRQLGTVVQLIDADQVIFLSMTELSRSPLDGAEWEAFALYLEGDPERQLAQGIYRLAHPAFGEQDLFLSPKSPVQYEISISRRRET